MSKKKNLMVLLIVFAALIAVYAAVSAYSDYAQKKQEEQEAAESEAERIWVTDIEEVKEISYDNGTDSLAFVKEDDEWKYKDAEDFPLVQSYLTALEETASHLEASRKLEGGDELEAYGLAEPAATVTVTDSSGNEITLGIGNSVDDEYYLAVDGEDIPYTVSSTLYNQIQYSLYDMVQIEEFPDLSEDTLVSVEVTNESGTYTLERLEVGTATLADATGADATAADATGADAAEDSQGQTETDTQAYSETEDDSKEQAQTEEETEEEETYAWYLNETGKRFEIENESLCSTLLNDLYTLSFESCENYKGDETQLEKAGLSESDVSFTVTYLDDDGEEAEFTVIVGNQKEQDEDDTSTSTVFYARLSDSAAINTLSDTVVEDITGSQADDYLE